MSADKLFKNKIFRAVLAAVFWIAVWQTVYLIVGKDVLVASPAAVIQKIFLLAQTGEFWLSAAFSVLRIIIGWTAGVAVGSVMAVITKKFSLLDAIFSPVIGVVRATPVASFIILALVWLQRQTIPSFISFLMVLPIVWGNVSEGIDNIPKGYLELAKVYRFSFVKRLKKIEFMSVKPYFEAACRTSLGLAWKAGIAAEVLCRPESSIGSSLWASKIYLETTDLFAWTAVVIILSFVLEKLMVKYLFGGRKNDKG